MIDLLLNVFECALCLGLGFAAKAYVFPSAVVATPTPSQVVEKVEETADKVVVVSESLFHKLVYFLSSYKSKQGASAKFLKSISSSKIVLDDGTTIKPKTQRPIT